MSVPIFLLYRLHSAGRHRNSYLARLFLAVLALALAGCNMPAAVGASAWSALAQGSTPTARPLYVAPAGATATPTPFQPLAPTAVLEPTQPVTPTPLPTETPTHVPTRVPLIVPTDERIHPQVIENPKGQLNILLLGSDQRPWDTIFRTDTLLLVTINAGLNRVNVTSFPRDLYVTIPGYGMNRINTAYQLGGFDLVGDTFEYNLGVRPDQYVLINFRSFKQIIDGLDGLDVNVQEAVSDYRNGYWVTVPEGVNHMNADDVLWYVRTRKTTNDFQRTRRQQEVMRALLEKLISLDAIRKAPEFYNIYKENVTTTLTLGDLLPYVPVASRLAKPENINQYFIGPQQTYDWFTYEGAMVLMPIQEEVNAVMRKALNLDR